MAFRFDPRELARQSPTTHAFRVRRRVLFQDIDAAGIVYFSRILDYFHDTYVDWLAAVGSPLPQVLAEKRWAAPLRHVEADYFQPLHFGAEIELRIVAAKLEQTRVTLGHQVSLVENEAIESRVAAVGQTQHVWVDPKSFQPIDIPEELRAPLSLLSP